MQDHTSIEYVTLSIRRPSGDMPKVCPLPSLPFNIGDPARKTTATLHDSDENETIYATLEKKDVGVDVSRGFGMMAGHDGWDKFDITNRFAK